MKLADKVSLVTGASRGIGKAIALELARQGSDLALNYVADQGGLNKKEAEEVAAAVRQIGRKALVVSANVGDENEVNQMVRDTVEQLGKIDILVNSAGINRDRTLKNLSKKEWDEVIGVNLTGIFNCCKAVVDMMRARGSGRIISISSVVGQMGGFGVSNYAASKAGIIGLTKSLAREVADKKITVNAIAPGFFETGMFHSIPEKAREAILKQIPLGRWGQPEEIGRLVVYLASDDAGYITGQVININGGFYM